MAVTSNTMSFHITIRLTLGLQEVRTEPCNIRAENTSPILTLECFVLETIFSLANNYLVTNEDLNCVKTYAL